ncbi:hypothetical protein CSOJ01_01778 [Colletotrichum sojae]|uniref:Uncharacterized protein n=1 Tax=Colletotrichum sojae TaxID=2175907 RepID=A0A8H6N3V8_9PEZI|nr:hypothetical protein CSOJ01_01778 [Colletotrichum sojae]
MSESARQRGDRPGVLHGTTAPLGGALRSVLFDALEAIHAAGGHDESPNPDIQHHPVVKDENSADARDSRSHDASERLIACLKHWRERIHTRDLRQQRAIFHLHPPKNRSDFESWVMGNGMSAADSALVTRLRRICSDLAFEVFPVVLEYTGTTCQYKSWISHPHLGGHVSQAQLGENGYWKTYQHVRHTPQIHQFKSFAGPALAEEMECDEGNVVDERSFAWERARRGIFFWQTSDEERHFEEERQARQNNPKWYQNIIPGSTADLGKYYAPAIMIVPINTQLDLINNAKQARPAAIWRYLIRQCKESRRPELYYGSLSTLCSYALPGTEDASKTTRILGMEIEKRQEWVKAIDPGIMGNLISTALTFRDVHLFQHLVKHTPVRPAVNYIWLCQNGEALYYNPAAALEALRRFLFQDGEFLQTATAIDTMPSYAEDRHSARVIVDLIKPVLAEQLESLHRKGSLSASHGRVVANFLKFFEDFHSWSEMVTSAISRPYQLWRHTQFTLGLLNRLLEMAKRDTRLFEPVRYFYRKYEELIITLDDMNDDGALLSLISDVLRDKSPEAQTARRAWREPEPTAEAIDGKRLPPPTSFAVIAGLFRNLERLDMRQEAANFAQCIVMRKFEIRPIYMATLWLPCLRVLQDLVDPEDSAYRSLFQTLFERYATLILDDPSLKMQEEPEMISPMATCCTDCKYLNAFFEQPRWKTFHLVKPKAVLEHIQGQLREQRKSVEIKIYGKNEGSMTMQLTKASLVNKEVLEIRRLRAEEASRVVRTFDASKLQQFLGAKEDIMWRLANAAPQDSAAEKTPTRSTESPSAGGADTRDSIAERASTIKPETPTTPKVEPGDVKAEPSSSATRTVHGTRSIRDLFASVKKESVKKEQTPASSHDAPRSVGLSTRDRLKTMGSLRRESAPKLSDPARQIDPFRRTPSKTPAPAVAPGSSSRAPVPPVRQDPLASFGGVRSMEPVRSGARTAGSSIGSTPTTMRSFGLAGRSSAAAGPSSTPRADSASGSSSGQSRGFKEADLLSAVLEAEKARKKRPSGSTWEVRTAGGSVVGSGTSSSAMAKSRFDGLATDKENPRHSKPYSSGLSQGSSSRGTTALASRSPNVGMNGARTAAGSATAPKRKLVDNDDDIIDLCGSDFEPVGSKRQKTTAVFKHFDDDPFGE